MFPPNINNHYALHNVRQRDLEAAAENYRHISSLVNKSEVSPLRQRVGSLLIGLGQKVAQQPNQDVRLVLSTRQ